MEAIHINNLIVNRETYDIIYREKRYSLTRKEFELIFLLASNPYRVFTREEITKVVWKYNPYEHNDRTIDVHIRKLRIKLNDELIYTVKGVGYKLLEHPE